MTSQLHWWIPAVQQGPVWFLAICPSCRLPRGHEKRQGAERHRRELIGAVRDHTGQHGAEWQPEWLDGAGRLRQIETLRYTRDGRTCCACGVAESIGTDQAARVAPRAQSRSPLAPTEEEMAQWAPASVMAAETRLAALRQRGGRWTGHRVILEHLRSTTHWTPGHQLAKEWLPVGAELTQWIGSSGQRRARELALVGQIAARLVDGFVEYRWPVE